MNYEKVLVDDHIDELEMFYGVDYGDIEDFFSPEFNINDLTEDKTPQYLKVTKFYEEKLSQSKKAHQRAGLCRGERDRYGGAHQPL